MYGLLLRSSTVPVLHFVITGIICGAEPHHFYAAPAPSKNVDAAPTSASTLP
jgi:hypothetical protein